MYSKILVLAFFSTLFALAVVATPNTQIGARQYGIFFSFLQDKRDNNRLFASFCN
jgi:hypothetical protein